MSCAVKGMYSPAKPAGRHMGSHCLKLILSGFAAGLRDTRWVTLEPPTDGMVTSRLPALPSSDAASSSFLFGSSATTLPVVLVCFKGAEAKRLRKRAKYEEACCPFRPFSGSVSHAVGKKSKKTSVTCGLTLFFSLFPSFCKISLREIAISKLAQSPWTRS